MLIETQLTPFVTKSAEPPRSKYTKMVEHNGREFTVVDSLKGKDYLGLWHERNGEEVYQREVDEHQQQ